jgi:hypothetical protein
MIYFPKLPTFGRGVVIDSSSCQITCQEYGVSNQLDEGIREAVLVENRTCHAMGYGLWVLSSE